jgi:membrane protein implicated in regulation of membrane protease activity
MKILLIFLIFILGLILAWCLFVGLLMLGSSHRIPQDTTYTVTGVIVSCILLIRLLWYFYKKQE